MSSETKYLSSKIVRRRYGISGMTLHRWQNDIGLKFPPPIVINGRKLWAESELQAWERSKAATSRGSGSNSIGASAQ